MGGKERQGVERKEGSVVGKEGERKWREREQKRRMGNGFEEQVKAGEYKSIEEKT